MRIYRTSLVVALMGVAWLGTVASATAATKPAPVGVIHIYEVSKGVGGPISVVVTGVINDAGLDQAGKLVLSKGSFEVTSSTKLKKQLAAMETTPLNATTCAATDSVTGSAALSGGTGSYKSISGTVSATHTTARIGSLKSGKCDTSAASKPIGVVNFVQGAGLVQFK